MILNTSYQSDVRMTVIIAEAGVNHNGDKGLAFKLIDAAFQAGADIVKFQTFKAENLASCQAEMADYQVANTGKKESQFEMLKSLELPYSDYLELMQYANQLGIEFLSTAFDEESLAFLIEELELQRLKIPSGELTNAPLVLAHARAGCDLIISTGMATLSDIEFALGVVAFGMLADDKAEPCAKAFKQAYASAEGQNLLRQKVTLLHCTTDYPATLESVNLRAMKTLERAFNLPVGYSDHTQGMLVSIGAAALGATVIEKHFTLDQNLEGPDHKASLSPEELKEFVKSVRGIDKALGTGVKFPNYTEIPNMHVARKSLVANAEISAGDIITEDVLSVKRPGQGMPPKHYWEILGRVASRDYKNGDLLEE